VTIQLPGASWTTQVRASSPDPLTFNTPILQSADPHSRLRRQHFTASNLAAQIAASSSGFSESKNFLCPLRNHNEPSS
jgi:hypothetical protein